MLQCEHVGLMVGPKLYGLLCYWELAERKWRVHYWIEARSPSVEQWA